MRFEDSKYFKELEHKKLEFGFGDFYLCNHFFVSEIHEGKHFDWNKVKLVLPMIIEHYGEDGKVVYISNRINSYSSEPQSWEKLLKKHRLIIASAIVYYNKFSFINATLEKHFSKISIKRCLSLDEAIEWVGKLKEFN